MKPVLQALLLADHVYQDKATGKKIVAGIFHRILTQVGVTKPVNEGETQLVEIPIEQVQQAGTPFVYINLTEVRGSTELQLRLVALESNEVCFQSYPVRITCSDPLANAEIVMPLPRLPSVPGTYALELLCENEMIGAYRVVVQQVSPKS